MATTEEILEAARQLGKLLASHPAAIRFEETVRKLQNDVDAQRVLNDYNRHLETLAQKQAAGQPIEVEDKRRLDALQQKVIEHPLLQELQVVQMDYLDLMRRVDEAMSPGSPAAAPPNVPPIVGPDMLM